MRLRATITLVLAGLGLALLGPAAAASAYPVVTCSTLAVSTTTPAAGETITVSGTNFRPNETVRLELHTDVHVLKTLTTGADGSFSTEVTLPDGVTGTHLLVAVGASTKAAGCPADPSVSISIQGSGVGGVATSSAPAGVGGQSDGPGSTAFTGMNVLLLLIVAAILIVLGVMLNRRNAAKHAMPRNDY